MAKTQKPLEQQIECAQARAKTAKIDLLSIYADGEGNVTWTITSERDANTWYYVTYGTDNHLTCDCPAQCVCKHIGLVLNRNVNYTRTGQPANPPAAPAAVAEPVIEETEAEPVADFPMLMDIEMEVAIVEAEMALAGYYWTGTTWERMEALQQVPCPGFTVEEARHDPRPMRWNQQRGCYEVISQEEIASRDAAIKPLAKSGVQARQQEEW